MKISELAFLKHPLFYQLLPFLKFEPPPPPPPFQENFEYSNRLYLSYQISCNTYNKNLYLASLLTIFMRSTHHFYAIMTIFLPMPANKIFSSVIWLYVKQKPWQETTENTSESITKFHVIMTFLKQLKPASRFYVAITSKRLSILLLTVSESIRINFFPLRNHQKTCRFYYFRWN